MNAKIYVYLPSYSQFTVETMHKAKSNDFTYFDAAFPERFIPNDYVKVGMIEGTIKFYPKEVVTSSLVESLEQQKKNLTIEYEKKLNQLHGQIQNLVAITYDQK